MLGMQKFHWWNSLINNNVAQRLQLENYSPLGINVRYFERKNYVF